MSIQNNTTELQAILAAVNALPASGSGGGIETCTVVIEVEGYLYAYSTHTAYEDGVFTTKYALADMEEITDEDGLWLGYRTTLENVVVGSQIILWQCEFSGDDTVTVSGDGIEVGRFDETVVDELGQNYPNLPIKILSDTVITIAWDYEEE